MLSSILSKLHAIHVEKFNMKIRKLSQRYFIKSLKTIKFQILFRFGPNLILKVEES